MAEPIPSGQHPAEFEPCDGFVDLEHPQSRRCAALVGDTLRLVVPNAKPERAPERAATVTVNGLAFFRQPDGIITDPDLAFELRLYRGLEPVDARRVRRVEIDVCGLTVRFGR